MQRGSRPTSEVDFMLLSWALTSQRPLREVVLCKLLSVNKLDDPSAGNGKLNAPEE